MNNLLASRFATSDRLAIHDMEWLQQGMGVKTVKFDIGVGGLPPEVNWEDKAAAIAMIDDEPARSLASILIWSTDTNWDWSRHFDTVTCHLAENMIQRCNGDGRKGPRACKHTLSELAQLMARMVLYFELYELWDIYTVKGRLKFSSIEVNSSTYTNIWLTYQRHMIDDLVSMVNKIDCSIARYRKNLNFENS